MVRERLILRPLTEVRDMMRTAFPCPGRIVQLPVTEANGHMTATAVHSPLTVPVTDIAARDGFAVVSSETSGASDRDPAPLKVPCRVNTGNAIPSGYDAVVMIEDVIEEDGVWWTCRAVSSGENVHPAGEEIRKGDLILQAGHRIRPYDIGALLTYGVSTIDVRAVRVGLIPTGSELVPTGEHPGPGEMIESNTAVAAAWAGEVGAICTRYPIVRDDPELLREAIARGAKENDLLLISAGSSAGTRDFTASVIADLGEVLVHGIAMKPGKPAIVGRIDGKPVIGMPGYPIAAMTVARELALPLLSEWGFSPPYMERLRARLTRTIRTDPGFEEYIFLTVTYAGDQCIATPLPRGAGTQMSVVRANAYLPVPAGMGIIHEGMVVEVLLTGPPVQPIDEGYEIQDLAPGRRMRKVGMAPPLKDGR